MLAGAIDAEGATVFASAHHFDELLVLVQGDHPVVEGDPCRQTRGDLARVDESAPLLRVVVRARAAVQDPKAVAVGEWLRDHSRPDERVFVWGHYTPIYTIAHRLPGTRYPNTSVHMGNFDPAHLPATFDPAQHRSPADVEATLEDLEKRRPSWFVDTSPAGIHLWDRVPLSAFPELARYRDDHYLEVARPGGAPVYRRRDEPAAQARGEH